MKKIVSLMLAFTVVSSAVVMSSCNDNNNVQKQTSKVESSTVQEAQSKVESIPQVSTDPDKPAITSAQLKKLNEEIAASQKIPEFTCTSEVIKAKDIAKGKKITYIPDNSGLSYTELVSDQLKTAAKDAGFEKFTVTEADGSSSKTTDALDSAVTDKSDLAIMFGNINKDSVSSGIEKTQANGIEVVSAGSVGVDQKDRFVDYSVPINYERAGKLMADWAIVKTNGKVNVLAVNNTDSVLSGTVFNGFKAEYEEYINSESGYCVTVNSTSIEAGNGLAERIKKIISEDKNISYIAVFDDSMIGDAVSAVDQVGGSKTIKIISTGGSKEAFDSAQNGNLEMLVAQSYEWVSYAVIDYVLRIMGGSTLPEEQDAPFRVVTSEMIKKEISGYSGNFVGYHEICFGGAFVRGYANLWDL